MYVSIGPGGGTIADEVDGAAVQDWLSGEIGSTGAGYSAGKGTGTG
jgi:hypothetical protein